MVVNGLLATLLFAKLWQSASVAKRKSTRQNKSTQKKNSTPADTKKRRCENFVQTLFQS
jgi:hypothetical protein